MKDGMYDNKQVLKIILNKGKVVTTREIAGELNVSWNTAEKALLELALAGKLKRLKKAGVNLWVLV